MRIPDPPTRGSQDMSEKPKQRMRIVVQIQPDRIKGFDLAGAINRLLQFGKGSLVKGKDRGKRWVNVTYRNTAVFWSHLEAELKTNDALAKCAIIVRETKPGWLDYDLLHHFDIHEMKKQKNRSSKAAAAKDKAKRLSDAIRRREARKT